MPQVSSPYDSPTFGNPLSLRVDGNFLSTMSVAPNGRDAVLAGRKGLFVIDLDDPFAAPRWLRHETSWEVADVQWSTHASKPSWIVSTSNQKAMVWNLARPSHDAIEHVLHAHTRAITDINFHPNNPELLVTCSVDSFVLAWDMRMPKAPINQWADFRAASSQVKWNYMDPNILASAHDTHVLIWDSRKGAIPLERIPAHEARINGLDWSRNNKYELITCSNDMTVKFWSYDKSCEKPIYTIHTDFPVARARHVPFGDHMCGIMPQRGGNNSVFIVKYGGETGESKLKPSYLFKGHTEPVKDFIWRKRQPANCLTDEREFQLVTWSADCDLRLWPIRPEIYDNFNYTRGKPLQKPFVDFDYRSYRPEPQTAKEENLIIRRHGNGAYSSPGRSGSFTLHNNQFNHLNWISGIRMGQAAFDSAGDEYSMNLGEEVSTVGHKFPKLSFEKISVSTGNLVISLNGPWGDSNEDLIFVRVEITFPEGYPSKDAVPKFTIEKTHDLNEDRRQQLLTSLREISTKYCAAKRPCLEPCMRYLLGEKVNLDFDNEDMDLSLDPYRIPYSSDDDSSLDSIRVVSDSDSDEGLMPDDIKNPTFDSTPVAKGCGAIWTASGHLVCFFNSKEDKKETFKFGQQAFGLAGGFRKGAIASTDSESSDDSTSSSSSLANDLDVLQYDRLYRKVGTGSETRENTKQFNRSLPTEKSTDSGQRRHKNVVQVYDYTRLLPARMELAYGYRVLGDTPENLALHNAEVSDQFGYKNLADCWRLLSILLVKDVKLDQNGLQVDHFVRAVDPEIAHNYRFYWGSHPFGGQWLATKLMAYYERIGDIQMLAMMSCLLYEHTAHRDRPDVPINTPYSIPQKLVKNVTLRPQYHSSVSFNRSLLPLGHSNSTVSSVDDSTSRNSFQSRTSNRSNSPSVAVLAGGESPISQSANRRGIKLGSSPVELSHTPDSVGSSLSNTFAHSFERFNLQQRHQPLPAPEVEGPIQVQIKVMNEKSLDLYENVYSFNLEGLMNMDKLKMYRAEYAELLFLWGLPVSRVKFLKFNYEEDDEKQETSEFREHLGDIGWIQEPLESYELDGSQTLNEKNMKRSLQMQRCHYCQEPVRKRLTACSHCFHIMHSECATKWWAQDDTNECPSGCGCHCLEYKLMDL